MDYRLLYTQRALNDLAEAIGCIAEDDAEASSRFGASLLDHVDLLARVPRLGSVVRRRSRVRKLLHSPMLVYYRIDEKKRLIEILHLRHAARVPPRRLPRRRLGGHSPVARAMILLCASQRRILRSRHGALILAGLIGFVCGGRAASQPQTTAAGAPQVQKIDPPNWWVGPPSPSTCRTELPLPIGLATAPPLQVRDGRLGAMLPGRTASIYVPL